ncbi:MAG: SDR family NAD(P)-dependent oxidoreductase [Isosphaeraceae bacterium]
MNELEGRVAVVTGASRGIGRSVALALAEAGCHVVVNYRQRSQMAEETAEQVRATGRKALVAQADVADPDQVTALAARVHDAFGVPGIVINNAGMAEPRPLNELTLADFDAAIAVNLRSAFLVTQAFLPAMREAGWGRLIFVSSVAAQVGGVVGPHYAASKAGLHGLAHAYASVLAREGITANVIAPALVDTEMVRNNPRASAAILPVGRFGTVEETTALIVAVAGNAYVTGQTFNVNGGWYFS